MKRIEKKGTGKACGALMMLLGVLIIGSHAQAAEVSLRLTKKDGVLQSYYDQPAAFPVCREKLNYISFSTGIDNLIRDDDERLFLTTEATAEIFKGAGANYTFTGQETVDAIREYEDKGLTVAYAILYHEDWLFLDGDGGPWEEDVRLLSVEELANVRAALAASNLQSKDTVKLIQLVGVRVQQYRGDTWYQMIENPALMAHLANFDGIGTECHIGDHNSTIDDGPQTLDCMALMTKWARDNQKTGFIFMGGTQASYTQLAGMRATYDFLWDKMDLLGIEKDSHDLLYFRQGARPGTHLPESSSSLTFQVKELISKVENNTPPPINYQAVAHGHLASDTVWDTGFAPLPGDTNVWRTGSFTLGADGQANNLTTNFHGQTLVVESGGQLSANAVGPTIVMNNLVLDGGLITTLRNNPFVLNLNGNTFTLNSGTLEAGGNNAGRDIIFRNAVLTGSGTIAVQAIANTGSSVEFITNIDSSGFTGQFHVSNNGLLKLGTIASTNASFGLELSGIGSYWNNQDVALISLVIAGSNYVNGVYAFSDFPVAHQAFIGNNGGIITVGAPPPIDPYVQWETDHGLLEGKTGDDDDDGLSNIYEYGLGGNPTNGIVDGHIPTFGAVSNGFEYVHVQRSAVDSGITYTVEASTNLVSGTWSTNGVEVTGTGFLNAEFNAVTNRFSTDIEDEQFIRLIIE